MAELQRPGLGAGHSSTVAASGRWLLTDSTVGDSTGETADTTGLPVEERSPH